MSKHPSQKQFTPNRVELRKPIEVSAGKITAVDFKRITLGDILALSKKGDVLSPDVAAHYISKFGSGVKEDGGTVAIKADDVLNATGASLGLAAAFAFFTAKDFSREAREGEILPSASPNKDKEAEDGEDGGVLGEKPPTLDAPPWEGDVVVRLSYPLNIKGKNGDGESSVTVEWLKFAPKKYKDIGDFVRAYVSGSPDKVKIFIQCFARLPQELDGYPLDFLVEKDVLRIDASDAERIGELVMPVFIDFPG